MLFQSLVSCSACLFSYNVPGICCALQRPYNQRHGTCLDGEKVDRPLRPAFQHGGSSLNTCRLHKLHGVSLCHFGVCHSLSIRLFAGHGGFAFF